MNLLWGNIIERKLTIDRAVVRFMSSLKFETSVLVCKLEQREGVFIIRFVEKLSPTFCCLSLK